MPVEQAGGKVGAAGGLDIKKILKTEEVLVAHHAETIDVPPEVLGKAGEAILTRIRFHEHDATYDVVGWNATTGTLICQRVA